MSDNINPCPFCGGKATTYQDILHGEHFGHFVACTACGARVKRIRLKEAIAAWNTRAERTCEGCVFDGMYANNCSFCTRDQRLTDQFITKVVE